MDRSSDRSNNNPTVTFLTPILLLADTFQIVVLISILAQLIKQSKQSLSAGNGKYLDKKANRNMARERIKKDSEEISKIMHGGNEDFIGQIYEIGNYQIQICIKGPDDSPYKSYLFFLNFQFSNEYPQIPPQVTFMNKIFHPNINVLGYIYLGILKDDWRSDFTINTILMRIKQLLKEPDVENSFFPEATSLYLENKIEFERKAKEWAQKYAIFNVN